MRIIIRHIPYKPEHAKDIMKQGATGFCEATEEEIDVAAKAKLNGEAYTFINNGRIIACGGVELLRDDVYQAWFLCVNDINPMEVRYSKREWIEKTKGLGRVQAPLQSDFSTGVKFAEFMGLKYEQTIPQFHTDGNDALMYVLGDI